MGLEGLGLKLGWGLRLVLVFIYQTPNLTAMNAVPPAAFSLSSPHFTQSLGLSLVRRSSD